MNFTLKLIMGTTRRESMIVKLFSFKQRIKKNSNL